MKMVFIVVFQSLYMLKKPSPRNQAYTLAKE